MSDQKHVAVLMGGWSSERPVSLSSGAACASALQEAGYKVSQVDVGRDLAEQLSQLRPDVAFNALHGPFGEDGTVQGLLELLEIPYTHSGVLASALAMDKQKSKAVLKPLGVPLAQSMVMSRFEIAKGHPMKPPYVIKPVNEGSSFGVLIVRADQDHPAQQLVSDDWPYGDIVMVERYVAGRELTCAVMGDVALGVTEIIPKSDVFYDFDAKYSQGGSDHIIPAQIDSKVYAQIQSFALKAHQGLGCRGVTRSDFRLDDGLMGNGELVWLELNNQPGMTPTSLLPEQAAHAGHDFKELVSWVVEDASCNR